MSDDDKKPSAPILVFQRSPDRDIADEREALRIEGRELGLDKATVAAVI